MDLDLSFLGWAHSATCVAALALGAAAFLQRKGSPAHRWFGRTYLISQLAVNASALGIYRRHMFWFPHWFAIAALVCIAVGYLAVRFKVPRRGWIHLHLTGMIASYYVLVGGGVNEVYLRVLALHSVVVATHGAAIGITHMLVMAAFVALIVAANFTVAAPRGRNAMAPESSSAQLQ